MLDLCVKDGRARAYYEEALRLLNENGNDYLIGGAFAVCLYTQICRSTKDLDIFCREEDYRELLKIFQNYGYKTEITDPRWIAKSFKDDFYIDIIFSNTTNIHRVDDSWFDLATENNWGDIDFKMISAEDLLWSKIYIQNRERYDGADINHLILRYGDKMNWERVESRMKEHWRLLLSQFLNFQFVYPSEQGKVPRWLFHKLLQKAEEQYDLPQSQMKICLGPLLDHTSYRQDIVEWDYKSLTSFSI